MNIDHPYILIYIGIGLLLFVVSLLLEARRKVLAPQKVKLIIIQDLAWVVGSAILLLWDPVDFSLAGQFIVGGVAVVVLILAMFQSIGLRKLK